MNRLAADGPWFFLIAQSMQADRAYRLIGITDTGMLRPQVFALRQGATSIGFAASVKQAIDAVFSLASVGTIYIRDQHGKVSEEQLMVANSLSWTSAIGH